MDAGHAVRRPRQSPLLLGPFQNCRRKAAFGTSRRERAADSGQQMDLEDQKREIESLRRQIQSSASSRASADVGRRVAQLEKENDELAERLHGGS